MARCPRCERPDAPSSKARREARDTANGPTMLHSLPGTSMCGNHILLLSIALLPGTAVSAQGRAEGRSFANPRVIGTAEGLLSTNVRDAVMDDEGFLWIATAEGLHRFDGSHMRVLRHDPADSTSIPADGVSCLLVDGKGALWLGTTTGGLARMDRSTLRCKRYRSRPQDARSLSDDHVVWAMEDRAGRLFFGTRNGAICLYRPNSEDFDRIAFPKHPEVYAGRMRTHSYRMVQDRWNGSVYWCATSHGILRLELDGRGMRYLTMPEVSKAYNLDKRSNNFRELVQAPDGTLLATTWGAGVVHMDTLGRHFRRYAIVEDGAVRQFANTFNALAVDANGSILLGNNTTGLALLDTAAGRVDMLEPGDRPELMGLKGQGVLTLRTTPAGDLLVVTRQDVRLFSEARQRFHSLRFASQVRPYVGLHDIRCLVPLDDGSVLVSGYGLDGVYRFHPGTARLQRIAPPDAVWREPAREHFSVDGMVRTGEHEVLAIGAFKLYRIDTRSGVMREAEGGFNRRAWNGMFQGLYRHSSGELYVLGRHDGLIRLDAQLNVIAQYLPDARDPHAIANGNYLYTAAEDARGRLWVGHDRGYCILDPGTGHFLNLDPATRADSTVRLSQVRAMAFDARGRLHMADATAGVAAIEDPLGQPFATRSWTRANGLPFDRAGSLFVDHDGSLWSGGAAGLAHRSNDGSTAVFTAAMGLPAGDLGGPLVRNGDGLLVGASGRFLYWGDPYGGDRIAGPLPMRIASIKVFDRELDPQANYSAWSAIRLGHEQNFFTLTFSVLDVRGLHKHRIEYRLAPFFADWTGTSAEGVAVLTNVPGGAYTLHARAVGPDGDVLGTMDLPLVVVPPYWETWWFQGAMALAILALIYSFYRIRISAIRKEARLTTAFNKRLADVELTALRAQMNPHFLFNSLNSIRHHVLHGRPDEADKYLGKFARLIRMILDHSDQRAVPLAEELESVRLYLEIEAARFDDKFSFHIHVDPEIDAGNTAVPPMLIQPYLENAIWHGLMQKPEGGELGLRIRRDGKALHIEVEDDGIGRARAAWIKSRSALKKRSMGMSITQQRLAMIEKQQGIRCDVRVEDLVLPDGEPGGTRVTITLPLA